MNRKPTYKKSESVKLLEQLANDEARRKHPDMPSSVMAPRLYRDDSANALTKCIIDWIRLHGGQAERINSAGRYIDSTKVVTDVIGNKRRIGRGHWIRGSGQRGTADISATINGYSIKIEVKIGRDRQSEDQKKYQEQVEAAGGIYLIASNFEVFLDAYNQIVSRNN